MPDSDANEPSKADLERRVDQLEATVQKMMPTRRGVLTGLAGAGIGGAAVYGASENARAQAAGAQGTEAEPNDMWAWNLNVANQVTSDLAMNGNDVTGVGAMDVGEVDYSAAISGTTTSVWEDIDDTEGDGHGWIRQRTTGVGTTATTILNFDGPFTSTGGFALVHGHDESSTGDLFFDVVSLAMPGGNLTVDKNNRSTPPDRTYSQNGRELQMAMASSTARVIAQGIAVTRSTA